MSNEHYAEIVKATKAAGGPAAPLSASRRATSKDVATPDEWHTRHVQAAQIARTLIGGTHSMRSAGEKYLPKFASESLANYRSRLMRSVCFNAFGKTVKDMTGKVFRAPITLGQDVDARLKEYAENIDNAGRHLNVFARDVFFDAMQTGINFILVEMPVALKNMDGRPVTVAQEIAAKRRPYLIHLAVESVIGFKSEQAEDGSDFLTQVRILETVAEPDGNYHVKRIEQVRVLEPSKWQIWRKAFGVDGRDEWRLFDEGATSLPFIPLVPVYINRTAFMSGSPPLADLADLNVAHWQSSSDQRNILTVARVPILFGTGMTEGTTLEIGASSMVRVSDPNAKLQWVEHSGAAIGAGENDLRSLELQMQNMGLQLLVPNPGQTATGEIRDEAKENSPLAMMATALQDALEAAFGMMAEYIGLDKDAGGSLVVNTDFGINGNIAEIQFLTQAVVAGKLDNETYLAELKRRGVLAEHVDIEVVLSRLANAPPDDIAANPMNLN